MMLMGLIIMSYIYLIMILRHVTLLSIFTIGMIIIWSIPIIIYDMNGSIITSGMLFQLVI